MEDYKSGYGPVKMDRDRLAKFIAALVEVAVEFDSGVTFYCTASNDVLRGLGVDFKGCGFGKQDRDSIHVTVSSPSQEALLRRSTVYEVLP